MECCEPGGFVSPFDEDEARRDRDRYHRRGPDDSTRLLLEMIKEAGVSGATVLDIGAGIGVIDQELLRAGASQAVLVEASRAPHEASRAEAEAAGLLDRMDLRLCDFVRCADDVPQADIVTLDRVVCCYPDSEGLIASSAARAEKLLGLVLPRDDWYVRWFIRLGNLYWRLRRSAYRAYRLDNEQLDRQLQATGLTIRTERFTWLWRVVLYARTEGTS